MTHLQKLSSKFGGLLKLAVSYGGFNPDGTKNTYNPTSTSNSKPDLEVQDLDGTSDSQVQSFALDGPEGQLKDPEYLTNRYDRMPAYAAQPALFPQFEGAPVAPPHPQINKYLDPISPTRYSTEKMNQPSQYLGGGAYGNNFHAYRNNSMETGREGILRPYTGMVGTKKTPNNPFSRDGWSEFVPAKHSLSRRDQRKLNQQFMLRKDPTAPASASNSVGTLRKGNQIMMTDPVVNRNHLLRKMNPDNIKGVPLKRSQSE